MAQTKKYKVTFSKAIDSISGTAISEESVINVKLPKTLNSASHDAFSGCTSLDTITIVDTFKRKRGDDFIKASVNGSEVIFDGL